jgi:hypothetical protein
MSTTEMQSKPMQWQVLNDEEKETLIRHHREFDIARDVHDQGHDELDEMNIPDFVEFNAKTANSFIPPRKNAADINIVTGIPREKLLDIASNMLRLNFRSEALAFSEDNLEDSELGRLFTFMVHKANEMEGDELKQLLRIMHLLEQGTIFVEEAWVPNTKTRKKIINPEALDPADGFARLRWYAQEMTTYHCEKRIIDMTSVYLGNIKEFEINKQPYLFTREVVHYDIAEAIYGGWSEWQYVHAGRRAAFGEGDDDIPYRDFRLYELEDQMVEIVKYQNIWTDEYQIYINGVMMLPSGFPLPWEWVADGDEGKAYSITKTILEPISPFFAYGKSMMSKVRVHAELLDEMLRMMVYKTKQSINPPTGNMTGAVMPERLYDPARIWDGVDPRKLMPLINHNGVQPAEYQMYNLVREHVDGITVSQMFQGQEGQRNVTATQVIEMQRQAQLSLGLIMFAIRLMEEKGDYLRLQNILENWTKPIDFEVIDAVQGITKNRYREISLQDVQLRDRIGTARIKMIDHVPGKEERKAVTDRLLTDERKDSSKEKNLYLSMPLFKELKYRWKVKSNPSERESNDMKKVMFGESLQQIIQFFGPEQVNLDFWKKEFSKIWGHKQEDAFKLSTMADLQTVLGAGGQNGAQAPQGGPQLQERAHKSVSNRVTSPQNESSTMSV